MYILTNIYSEKGKTYTYPDIHIYIYIKKIKQILLMYGQVKKIWFHI